MEHPEKIKKFIYRYTIYRNGEAVESNLIGWQTTLARARKWVTNLFDERPQHVEILNIWTGEILTLEQAEERATKWRTSVAPHKVNGTHTIIIN